MRTRNVLLALALILSASVAANAAGDNVLLLTVGDVTVPAKLPGLCAVTGTVSQVWEGKAFHSGQAIALNVPCRGNEASLIPAVATIGDPNAPRFIAADILKHATRGLARLDDSGALIWDYSSRSYGPWGSAGGFRVLDGTAVPAKPNF